MQDSRGLWDGIIDNDGVIFIHLVFVPKKINWPMFLCVCVGGGEE